MEGLATQEQANDYKGKGVLFPIFEPKTVGPWDGNGSGTAPIGGRKTRHNSRGAVKGAADLMKTKSKNNN